MVGRSAKAGGEDKYALFDYIPSLIRFIRLISKSIDCYSMFDLCAMSRATVYQMYASSSATFRLFCKAVQCMLARVLHVLCFLQILAGDGWCQDISMSSKHCRWRSLHRLSLISMDVLCHVLNEFKKFFIYIWYPKLRLHCWQTLRRS
jgi:hypothetical protein